MKALARQAGLARNLAPAELLEGKYRLERVLGAGAMGRVWLARNIHLDAQVAIKIVERDTHGAEAMARVLTEARLEARLHHPDVVRALDSPGTVGVAYVVMELLEGCTLGDLMDEGPLPPALAVRLMLPLIDGLATAHLAGVVHRDIKPENVFIARNGERICPKLLDFGIAYVPSNERGRKRAQIVGTPGYMSPEQAYADQDIDARSDIWSLGVVLYEAVSGESAFGCADYRDYLRALNERVLPPLPECSGGDELWRILQRALCPSAIGRYTSCADLASALQGWLRSRGVQEDLTGDSLSPTWAMPGSLIARAIHRATVKHATFAERDSYAPTQPDLTTRRRPQRSSQRPISGSTLTPSHVTLRTSRAMLLSADSRSSTIRTTPHLSATRKQRWSAYALLAGAAFGVSFALVEARNEPVMAQRPKSEASQPYTSLTFDTPPPEPESRLLPRPPLRPGSDAAERVSVRPKPKPQPPAAEAGAMRKQASSLGLKSPW